MAKRYRVASEPRTDWYLQSWARSYGSSYANDRDAFVSMTDHRSDKKVRRVRCKCGRSVAIDRDGAVSDHSCTPASTVRNGS